MVYSQSGLNTYHFSNNFTLTNMINPKYISAAEVGNSILLKQTEKRDPKFYSKYRKDGLVDLHKDIYPLVKPAQEMALWPEFSLRKIKLFPGETLTDLLLANAIVLAHEYTQQEKSTQQLFAKAIEYYNELASKRISLASPFFNNLRKDGKANLSSCFIMEVGDSLKSIMKHVTYCAEISKAGGGAGVYVGKIRAKGAPVNGHKNAASSVMNWVRMFDQVCVSVNQLGQRPGAITVALPIWHADIEEFLDCQTENGDLRAKAYNIQPQVCIPDYFMKELEAGSDTFLFCPYQLEKNNINPSKDKGWYEKAVDKKLYRESVSARKLWAIIQEREMTVGRPYIFYTDNAQINSPFKKNYGNINSANLCCFSGETLILTKQGERPIASIAGTLADPTIVRVWNGLNYANAPVYKVADEQVLYRVTFSQGQYVDVTEDHNFFVATQASARSEDTDRYDKILKVQTRDLKKGMQLPLVHMPGTGSTSQYLQKAKNYVTKVTKLDGLHTVYCLTEPLRNMVIANGVPTGQCESYSYFEAERYIHCCNLASINLAEHTSLESISKSTEIATEMADLSLNLSFIDIEEAQNHVRDFRTIGVGMMGLADWLAANGEYYSSLDFIEKTQKAISIAAYKTSVKLASKWGACLAYDNLESELWDKLDQEPGLEATRELRAIHGIRNAMLLATAPNTSTSLVMGATASFLPPYSHEFYDESEDHTLPVVCKYDPDSYLTNRQIPQEFITDATAVMQKYMDAGISMEYLYPKGASWSTNKAVSKNKIEAWKKGVKAVYYIRTIDTKAPEVSGGNGTSSLRPPEIGGHCSACAN
jgi:ribonucleotide reductase alpha subunit